jgi:fatty-acyl-CoA synthase
LSREPSSLIDVYRRRNEHRLDSAAFTFASGRPEPYTYGELFSRSMEMAERLASLDLRRDIPFGILLQKQEDQVLHYLAALAAGVAPAILTPPNPKLNAGYYAETMAGVMAKCPFGAVVTDLDIALPVPTLKPYVFDRSNDEAWIARGERLDAAFLQFSSGTTGIKRGVLVSREAALAQIETYAETIELTAEDVILSWLPLYHDMGFLACLNMPLAFGAHTVMIDPIEWVTRPASFLELAAQARATLSWNPNFAYAFMAKRVQDKDLATIELSSFRGLVNCSEPVTHTSQEAFRSRFAPYGLRDDVFWGCYAMAETTFALTHGTAAGPDALDSVGPAGSAPSAHPRVSVGRPLAGVELRVAADRDEDALDRVVGELQVRSPFTAEGYYNDPVSTEAAFVGGWYRTGDLGYRVDGAFYVVGRSKDTMIVGGVNVFPQEIEETVSGVPGVIEGRVTAFSEFDPDKETERVTILFESAERSEEEGRALVLDVRQHVLAVLQLANFDVHRVPPGWLLKSSAGKIARKANQERWTTELGQSPGASSGPAVLPVSPRS